MEMMDQNNTKIRTRDKIKKWDKKYKTGIPGFGLPQQRLWSQVMFN